MKGYNITIFDIKSWVGAFLLEGDWMGVDPSWSPNGELLASIGYEDRFVRLWDPDTGRLYAEARHDSLPGWSISWSPDGNKIASGCGEWQQPRIGEIIVWIIS